MSLEEIEKELFKDFYGNAWASGFAVSRTIPMGHAIRSVVMGSVDPFLDERSDLCKSRGKLKVGFEIGSFGKIKKKVKEIIPVDKLKEKVEYTLKHVEELWVFNWMVFILSVNCET